jgi:peptidyl-prolyl cis-trans isomerase SurA
MNKLFRRVAAVVMLAAFAVPLRAQIIEQVLVKVNGDIITKTELENRQIAAIRQRMSQDVSPESLKNDEQLKKVVAEVTPRILVDAIDEMLMVQLAKERGYKLRDEQFREWLSALRKEQNLEDEARFQAALKQEGMTVDDLRKNVEKQFMISQVQREEVGSKLTITEEEARQYYNAHPQEFTTQANVTLREILVESPTSTQAGQAGVNVAQDDEARARANQIRGRILAGEDFGKVATEVSAAPSKSTGGLIGPINVSELSEALQNLLKTMKPGQVTAPIRVAKGYQILKLETLKESSVQAFEEVQDLVSERVHTDRQRREVGKFLARVRGQAIIEWKNAELKKAYDQLIQEGAKTQG